MRARRREPLRAARRGRRAARGHRGGGQRGLGRAHRRAAVRRDPDRKLRRRTLRGAPRPAAAYVDLYLRGRVCPPATARQGASVPRASAARQARPPPLGPRPRRALPHPRQEQPRDRARHALAGERHAATARSRGSAAAPSSCATRCAASAWSLDAGEHYLARPRALRRAPPCAARHAHRAQLSARAAGARRAWPRWPSGRALTVQTTGALDGLERGTLKTRFELRGAERPDDVVVVAIDAKSFDVLREQWPFPRSLHGRAIRRLHAAGAREIVYDVQFTEPTGRARTSRSTTRSTPPAAPCSPPARATAAATPTCSAATPTCAGDRRPRRRVRPRQRRRRRGHTLPARGGRARRRWRWSPRSAPGARRPPRQRFRRRRRLDRLPRPARHDPHRLLLRRRARAASRPARSATGSSWSAPSAPTLRDVHATPVGGDELMAGAEVQANAIWTAMHGAPAAQRLAGSCAAADRAARAGRAARRPALPRAARRPRGAGRGALFAGRRAARFRRRADRRPWSRPLVALIVGGVGTIAWSQLAESRARRAVTRDNEVLERRVRERTRELWETQLEILQRLGVAVEWRDAETGAAHRAHRPLLRAPGARGRHGRRRTPSCCATPAPCTTSARSGIPDEILTKPGPARRRRVGDDEDPHHDRRRASCPARAPRSCSSSQTIALTHHEHWDGGGYPLGLRGEQIPLAGRICAICDVFDALLSARPYKDPWPIERRDGRDRAAAPATQFDPGLVERLPADRPRAPRASGSRRTARAPRPSRAPRRSSRRSRAARAPRGRRRRCPPRPARRCPSSGSPPSGRRRPRTARSGLRAAAGRPRSRAA